MTFHDHRSIQRFIAAHHGVITRAQASDLGMTKHQIDWRLATGQWEPIHRGVFVAGGVPVSARTRLAAACQAYGPLAVASHRSAAWAHGLVGRPPALPELSVAHDKSRTPRGIVVHRQRDLVESDVVEHKAIRMTDVARTLVDLGAVVPPYQLDKALDVALARRRIAVAELEEALGRLRMANRKGPRQLFEAMDRRGFVLAPETSVLESETQRLLNSWGFTDVQAQVEEADGRYRLDFVLAPKVALEVDGFAYHSSPEAKAADARRRNALRALGWTIIECDWVTVMRRPHELWADICAVLAPLGVLPAA